MTKKRSKAKANSIPKHLIIFGALLVVVAIAFVILIVTQDAPAPTVVNKQQKTENNEQVVDVNTARETANSNGIFNPLTDSIETVSDLNNAIATTAGANLITPDGKVVNEARQVVKNNALPMTPEAPRLSQPINISDLLDGSIKITANEDGFSPNEFTIKTGEPVDISLTSIGVGSRLVFVDVSLIGLEIPVPAGYTMSKTFQAPVPGEYIFYQDMPGKTKQTGKMIVVE
jgi:hypothetical protein